MLGKMSGRHGERGNSGEKKIQERVTVVKRSTGVFAICKLKE